MGWFDRVGGVAHRLVRTMSGMSPAPRPASEVLGERWRLVRLVPLVTGRELLPGYTFFPKNRRTPAP